jgi:hypothetical protein
LNNVHFPVDALGGERRLAFVNDVHKTRAEEIAMLIRRSSLTLSALLLAGTIAAVSPGAARADSVGHSAQAAQHSGAAASHGVAGLASAGASVVAVPMMATGAASRAVGQAGNAVGASGEALFETANPGLPLTLGPAPDPAPRLD